MNEDFVSYELAVKLKEKGFKKECLCYYIGNDLVYNIESPIVNNQLWFCHNKYDNIWHRDNIDAPTISQVLKWLREEKDMVVSVNPYYGKFVNVHWWWDIRTPVYKVEICNNIKQEGFDSYELAAIAGIEYVIDNLI